MFERGHFGRSSPCLTTLSLHFRNFRLKASFSRRGTNWAQVRVFVCEASGFLTHIFGFSDTDIAIWNLLSSLAERRLLRWQFDLGVDTRCWSSVWGLRSFTLTKSLLFTVFTINLTEHIPPFCFVKSSHEQKNSARASSPTHTCAHGCALRHNADRLSSSWDRFSNFSIFLSCKQRHAVREQVTSNWLGQKRQRKRRKGALKKVRAIIDLSSIDPSIYPESENASVVCLFRCLWYPESSTKTFYVERMLIIIYLLRHR